MKYEITVGYPTNESAPWVVEADGILLAARKACPPDDKNFSYRVESMYGKKGDETDGERHLYQAYRMMHKPQWTTRRQSRDQVGVWRKYGKRFWVRRVSDE
jgi:hypothetical protein